MQRVLGVDPGSRLTGFGIIDLSGNQIKHVASGTIRLEDKKDNVFSSRLRRLHAELDKIIKIHSPDVFVIENVFFAKNAVSALKLGHARGVAMLAASQAHLEIHEYAATEVKQVLTGSGRADKEQVAKMVGMLLAKKDFDTLDTSDALALAICHAHQSLGGATIPKVRQSKRRGSMADAVRHATPKLDGSAEN